MTARDSILATIRRGLGVTDREPTRIATVDDRLARAPRGVVPARGQVEGEALLALFQAQAEAAQAGVAIVDRAGDVPGAVAEHIRRHNLPARARMGDDARLAAMPWGETAIEVSKGRSAGDDLVAVTHAFAAAAETGTLALVSGPDNPTTLNLLPDIAIVVLNASDLVGDYESLWDALRARFGAGVLPRTVNLITGPSRSADIEQTLLLGAHGPRSLHVVVVREG